MASATTTGSAASGLRIGDILNRSLGLWSKLVIPYGLIYAVATAPNVLQTLAIREHRVATPGSVGLMVGLVAIIAMLFGVLAQGVVISAANSVAERGTAAMGGSINAAMKRFFPLFGAAFCMGLTIALGFVLLIVPGLMLASAYFVVVPACVLEGLGPIKSIDRSARLTKGYRWRIFGLVLIMVVLSLVGSLLARVGVLMLGSVGAAILQLIATAAVGVFTSVVSVVAYRDMVAAKEGFGGQRIASVFD
jgi:hypothetical protein